MTRVKILFDIAWVAVVVYFMLQGLHSLSQLSSLLKHAVK